MVNTRHLSCGGGCYLIPFTADGAYEQDSVSAAMAKRHPEAAIIVSPRSKALPSGTAETERPKWDRHLQFIAEHRRAAW